MTGKLKLLSLGKRGDTPVFPHVIFHIVCQKFLLVVLWLTLEIEEDVFLSKLLTGEKKLPRLLQVIRCKFFLADPDCVPVYF